ncbi:PD40 domain-containing protein [Candidatus Chloroploca asiatica]|uniref:Peptidase S9 n=1 Tax=Candidatus Chloroploca asiatica TaxID=1506545 RepID=A0A2H3KQC2_9CHLR|nr:PD40 domain-containing protein [Candidatus Chloroploca asiatica]PDW00575.1 hypothetical protein A9Q02_09295 [Candidatus Chloroploca asiatica]
MQRFSLVLGILIVALLLALPAAPSGVQAQADQGRIVFVSYHEAEGKRAISVINPDGSGLTRLTSFDTRGDYAHPVWSPDGSQIAFTIYQQFRADAWHSDIYVMQADGSNIRRLTRLDWASQPVWSPDGQRIAFIYSENESARKLFTMRSDGSDIVEIPIFFQLNNERPNWIADLAWHPDGNRISFSSVDVREGEGVTYHYNYSAIYIVDKNGGAAQFLTAGSAPAWSPDGSRLAFIANTAGDVGFLFVMPADGSSAARWINEDDFFEAYEPTWSPDGSKIAYYGMELGGIGIFIVNADGSGRFKLVDDGRSPNWSRPAGSPAPAPPPPAGDERCFAETGFCIAGRIRSYWEQNGGLPVFGFPLTEQREEMIEGRAIQVQWFERNRLELHPANPRPYDVLLGRLGADRLAQRGYDWQAVAPETPQTGCRFFVETGRNVCGDILAAWRANGLELDGRPGFSESENLALFGLPLTGLITEQLSDGREYQVQYFERARFELHPENAPPLPRFAGPVGE